MKKKIQQSELPSVSFSKSTLAIYPNFFKSTIPAMASLTRLGSKNDSRKVPPSTKTLGKESVFRSDRSPSPSPSPTLDPAHSLVHPFLPSLNSLINPKPKWPDVLALETKPPFPFTNPTNNRQTHTTNLMSLHSRLSHPSPSQTPPITDKHTQQTWCPCTRD